MRLPKDLRPRRVIAALKRAGWTVERQTGSHVILSRPDHRPITVPNHPTIKPGTLKAIVRQAGLSVAEFIRLL